MSKTSPITIVNVGYRSTNYWVISAGRSRLLFDLGWPGMLAPLLNNLSRMDIPLKELHYGLASHYHPDHAGCAQELKNRGREIDRHARATPRHLADEAVDEACGQLRGDRRRRQHAAGRWARAVRFLARLGIHGSSCCTRPDIPMIQCRFLLDTGEAFTGDLTAVGRECETETEIVAASWQKLRELGATTIYPGHGPRRPI